MHVRAEVSEVGVKKSSKEKTAEGQRLTKLRMLLGAAKEGAKKFASPIPTR